MTGLPQPPGTSAQKTAEVTNAVRGLCTVLNTALMYQTSHPVFQRSVEQAMGFLATALKGIPEITLFFVGGEIRFGTLVIDPTSTSLRKVSQNFEARGIKGLAIQTGVTADDLAKFVTVLTARSNEIERRALPTALNAQASPYPRAQGQDRHRRQGCRRPPRPRIGSPPAPAPASAAAAPSRSGGSWDIEDRHRRHQLPTNRLQEVAPAPHPRQMHPASSASSSTACSGPSTGAKPPPRRPGNSSPTSLKRN